MRTFSCRVCGREANYVDTLLVGNYQLTNKPVKCYRQNTDIFACSFCEHVMIDDIKPDDFYQERLSWDFINTNYISNFRVCQIIQLNKLAEKKDFFLEVGCGTGGCLEIASKYFKEVIGVEPSNKHIEILESKNIPYIHGYFSKNQISKSCDAFLSLHVFEHLSNPTEVLKEIFDVCNDGAVGLIEVPDGQKVQSRKNISYILAAHVSYFSPLSLAFMARSAGFQVLSINTTKFGSLELYLKKVEIDAKLNFSNQVVVIEKTLGELRSLYKHISAWGAGAKMMFLLPMLEEIGLEYLFDNDPMKIGNYIYGCKTVISKPSIEAVAASEAILLFGTQYDDDIAKELQNKYNFTGHIVELNF